MVPYVYDKYTSMYINYNHSIWINTYSKYIEMLLGIIVAVGELFAVQSVQVTFTLIKVNIEIPIKLYLISHHVYTWSSDQPRFNQIPPWL